VEVIDPGTFFGYELLGGWLGAAGGGVGGFLLGFFACLSAVGTGDSYGGLACLAPGALGYLIGTPVGATAGVSLVGHLNGVEGNVWLALVGGAAGEGMGFLALTLLQNVGPFVSGDLGPVVLIGGVPLLSALGATAGYNVGSELDLSGSVSALAAAR